MDNPLNLPSDLLDIHLGLERGRRLTMDEAMRLFEYDDILTLAAMADAVARRKWAGRAFYGSPLRLWPGGGCGQGCALCDALPQALDDLVEHVSSRAPHEVQLVGLGQAPDLDDVERLFAALRSRLPDAWLQGLTTFELVRLSRRAGVDVDEAAGRLQQAGLDALLGTHEEVWTRNGHQLLHDPAMSADDEHAVVSAAHRAGLASIATLRYAPGQPATEVVARLDALREMQRKTGGFSVFAPLPADLDAGQRQRETPSGYEEMRMVAVGRLFLDNIPHVRVPWLALGLKMGPVALSFGADDLGWAALDAHVRVFAPSTTFSALSHGEIERAVHAARRRAVHVDGAFRERAVAHAEARR